MVAFNLDVPEATYIPDDRAAKKLLAQTLRKIQEDPDDFLGFDTETHGKKIPLKHTKGGKLQKDNPLDWMSDTVTFWSLAYKLRGNGSGERYERYCLQGQHLHMFVDVLENPLANLALWNTKYDAHVCYNSGIDIWCAKPMDFMIAGNLVDENLQGDLGLKECAPRGFAGRTPYLRALVEQGLVDPWKPIRMTHFTDIFGSKDTQTGKRIVEYETSLFDLPRDKVANYASLDAYATLKLAEHLYQILTNTPIDDHYSMWDFYMNMAVPFTEVLWRMERRGLGVDRKHLKGLLAPLDKEILATHNKINKKAGWFVDIEKTNDLRQLFFGERGGEQPGLELKPIKMTKGGAKLPVASTDESVLEIIALNFQGKAKEIAGLIRRYRSIKKTRNTYVKALLTLSGYFDDKRIHPNFKQAGARTGRLSTTTPNSQNFPRPDSDEFKIRKAFRAKKGKKLIVVDYEQLEMRIMAHMSQDKGMLDAIKAGLDLHCVTAQKMYGLSYYDVAKAKKIGHISYDIVKEIDKATGEEVEKEKNPITQVMLTDLVALRDKGPSQLADIAEAILEGDEDAKAQLAEALSFMIAKRQECKTTGFGLIYGAGAKRISEQLECSKEEAQEKINAYFAAFPGVKIYMDRTVQECGIEEFVTTITGRRRNLPDINSHQFQKRSHAEREAVNGPIQGSAADMAAAAMISIENDPELKLWGFELINQVHDELVGEAPDETAELCKERVKWHMENCFNGQPPLCVPTPADAKVVETWDAAK